MKISKYLSPFLLLTALLMTDCVNGTNGRLNDAKEGRPPRVASARPIPVDSKYSFVRDSLNRFQNQGITLDSICEVLYQLKMHPDSVLLPLSVLHIGDSHIQAGFLTGEVMRNMQNEFGNAGRGLVVPLRLAKTNEPLDYKISSSGAWRGGKIIERKNTLPIGVGGIALAPNNMKVDFTLKLKAAPDETNGFNRITIFSDAKSPTLTTDKRFGVQVDSMNQYPYAYRLELSETTDSIRLKGIGAIPGQSTYYGFSLENGQPGVLYHSVGINGAHYLDYQNRSMIRQTQALEPDLIVLSLGTNEAFAHDFTTAEFRRQLHGMVKRMRATNPRAVLLIAIPAECYIRSVVHKKTVYTPNARIAQVRSVLIAYAKENGIAYWDLFEITGGAGSCKNWFNSNLMARDRIHFTEEGYQLQGQLLYNAIITEYNEYLSKRNRSE